MKLITRFNYTRDNTKLHSVLILTLEKIEEVTENLQIQENGKNTQVTESKIRMDSFFTIMHK